ncbi:Methylcrotonoyl-CoA carboxylase beta chain, mitochondrial [Sarracenia purpurea var. burkii]
MGGEQAANMLIRVSKLNDEGKSKLKQQILKQFQEESQAYYASARPQLWFLSLALYPSGLDVCTMMTITIMMTSSSCIV